MPVVVMHGGSGAAGAGNSALSSKSMGPNSHLCIAVITLVVNPPLGLAALILSCWSRCTAARDWDGAEVKGRVAMYLSIAGIIISIVVLVVAVLFLFTKDT